MLYDNTPLREITGNALRPGGLELTRQGLELCSFAVGSRLLDLGCGPGATLELLRDAGYAAVGLDRSRKLLREGPSGAPRVQGDFSSLPFAESCLDGVLCECALSLAEDPASTLRECARVMKDKGRIMLSDIVLRAPAIEEDRGAGASAFCCSSWRLSLPSLLTLLREQGFDPLSATEHSALLAKLAAQIVWRFGSLDCFAASRRAKGEEPAPFLSKDTGAKYGYALVIAQKRSS